MEGTRRKELLASINFDSPALLTAENQREDERSKTQWALIEEGQGDENSRVIYCYSQEQLDDELAKCFRTGRVIVELFIDRQRLTDQERADFLAEASQAHEEHQAGR